MIKREIIGLASLLVLSVSVTPAQGQPRIMPRASSVVVEYSNSYNGKPTDTKITLTSNGRESAAVINETENIYINYDSSIYFSSATLPNGQILTTQTPFEVGEKLTVVGIDTIQSWACTKYRTTINSNTIEIWATTELGFSGTFQPQSGVPKGLVLKISRNGNNVTIAERITRSPQTQTIFPPSLGQIVDATEYRHALNNKDVITIPVFSNEYIGFNGAKTTSQFCTQNKDSVYTVAGGTVILRRVSLPKSIKDRNIFVRVVQQAVADAYDRTGSIFIIPTDRHQSFLDALNSSKGISTLPALNANGYNGVVATENYTPPLELMRFFTPFGVGGYNHIKVKGLKWADSVIYRQDVTNLASQLHGDVWIGAYIGNWVDKGHRLSLEISYHPSRKSLDCKEVIPLFNTVNLLEQAGQDYPVFFGKEPLKVSFTVRDTIYNPQLQYTSTGHGGWAGGDEFNEKPNTISLDGQRVIRYTPWREDCGSYRSDNPASGNYTNGLSSSDLSRSAWCPGRVTTPVYIDLGDKLAPGTHTIEVSIPQGDQEGTSISYWCISGAIIGNSQR